MLNPIEIFCYFVAQPVVDFLSFLLNDVHYLAFLAAVSVIGVLFGLFMGIITLICFKYQGLDEPKKEIQGEQENEIQSCDLKQKHE